MTSRFPRTPAQAQKQVFTSASGFISLIGTEGPNKGKIFPAIYETNGDTRRICYDLSGNSRPRAFKTEMGTQLFLVTYHREKP